jgi:hypothetical protein
VPYHLIVPREVSQAIGRFGLSRVALINLLTTLRQELEIQGDAYRQNRDPSLPDVRFLLELTVWDGGQVRGFRFAVDDAQAPGYFFAVAAEEI